MWSRIKIPTPFAGDKILSEIRTENLQHVQLPLGFPKCFAGAAGDVIITPVAEAKRFMKECYQAVGTPPEVAEVAANNLIEADYRGHYSHGMNRLEMYIRNIQQGRTDPKATPEVLKQTVATALVDGRNGLGSVIGTRCMDIAIEKAKDVGVGVVAARGSNHFGLAAIYGVQAIKQCCLGLTFSNTSPLMTPTRAKKVALGTNPLSLAAPGLNDDVFILDMATTAVAVGKIELARRKKMKLPEGWALNDEGKPETDPEIAFKARKLMPLGGTEQNSGYKGYGLAMLVEILCGILAGADYGPYVRRWGDNSKNANLGHCFIAIDPCAFEPCFQKRLSDLMDYLHKMEPADPKKPVFVHGDMEKSHIKLVAKEGGLKYVKDQHNTIAKLAQELKVKPPGSKGSSGSGGFQGCSNK